MPRRGILEVSSRDFGDPSARVCGPSRHQPLYRLIEIRESHPKRFRRLVSIAVLVQLEFFNACSSKSRVVRWPAAVRARPAAATA